MTVDSTFFLLFCYTDWAYTNLTICISEVLAPTLAKIVSDIPSHTEGLHVTMTELMTIARHG